MPTSLESIIGQKLMWSFNGHTPPPDRVIIGTINAYQQRGQVALIDTLIDRGKSVIAVALRMPYDVSAYPRVPTCLCTYSLQPAALQAAAKALWGQLSCTGQLPVELPEP